MLELRELTRFYGFDSYGVRVTSYELRVTGYGLRVEWRVTDYELRVAVALSRCSTVRSAATLPAMYAAPRP